MRSNGMLALKVLSFSVTVILLILMFTIEGSPIVNVCLGIATGLSLGLQVVLWSEKLVWLEDTIGDRSRRSGGNTDKKSCSASARGGSNMEIRRED
jgi:hypothetical protein